MFAILIFHKDGDSRKIISVKESKVQNEFDSRSWRDC